MNALTERLEVRLDPASLDRLDAWRAGRPGVPTRGEAVRLLINAGTTPHAEQPIRFTAAERLIIALLTDVHESTVAGTGDISPDIIDHIVMNGAGWALRWAYPHLTNVSDDDESTQREVVEILTMWNAIEAAVPRLTDEQRAAIINSDGVVLVQFEGFDGHDELEHIGIANTLIHHLNRWSRFKDRALDGVGNKLPCYRRMLARYRLVKPAAIGEVGLGFKDIQAILRAAGA